MFAVTFYTIILGSYVKSFNFREEETFNIPILRHRTNSSNASSTGTGDGGVGRLDGQVLENNNTCCRFYALLRSFVDSTSHTPN